MPRSLTKSISLRSAVAALAALCLLGLAIRPIRVHGQTSATTSTSTPPGAAPTDAEPINPADQIVSLSNLDAASQELREHLKKMRAVAIKYHLSDTPRQSKSMSDEWFRLLATGRAAHKKLLDGAMADFKAQPDLNSKAGALLQVVTGRNVDVDRIDHTFEAVQLLKEHGANSKQFELCYGLTAAGNNHFAAARPHLETAALNLEESAKELATATKISEDERKMVGEKMFETYELVKDLSRTEMYEKFWQEEQKAREADAAGEPLPRVLIETTKGSLTIELFENDYPNTVANFIELCEKGVYNGLPFHRVISHFMAQGGDPNRDGSGGPGYCIPTELNGKNDRGFFRGTLGMAMSGQPDSGGSQFFICYLPRAHLNGKYVAFARVIEGMDIVSDFAHINPDKKKEEHDENEQSWPDEIITAKVLNKRAHPYKVNKLPEPKPQPAPHPAH